MKARFRKTIKITKGIKLNLNKNSTSVTLGSGSGKTTFNSNGKVTRSVSIPHTGVYYTETLKGKNTQSRNKANGKTYSPAMYRTASVSAFVWGIICLLLGLVLLVFVPLLGILVSLFGWSCFFISNNFRKQAKQAKEKEKMEEQFKQVKQAEESKQHFE